MTLYNKRPDRIVYSCPMGVGQKVGLKRDLAVVSLVAALVSEHRSPPVKVPVCHWCSGLNGGAKPES